ncbi:MAG TPA: hypothetical protein VFH03_09305 [Actinoplanes sp.]|nr:hypothetical protein [Actinoplanes sp.]
MTATHRADPDTGRRPRTPTGLYLRATALNDRADEPPGEPALDVFARAFATAVRLRFRPDTPLLAVAASVAAAARRHPMLHQLVREAEMLIRQALGEQVPAAGITAQPAMVIHMLIFAALADEMALTDDEIDELIADAELGEDAQQGEVCGRVRPRWSPGGP